MSDIVNCLVAPFQASARAAEDVEKSFRESVRPRLESLERERVFAHRRMNLVIDMAREAADQETRETAIETIIAFVATAFALERGRDTHETILGRLVPVAETIARATHPLPGEDSAVSDLAAALAAFEAWYYSKTGTPFLTRADIVVAESPLVDW